MKVLGFDTAQAACSVALWHDGEIAAAAFRRLERGHAEHLLPMAEALRRDGGFAYADVDAFAATVGPGTFAGVRIALSAARAFGLANQKPVIGITTLEAIAAAVEEDCEGPLVAAIDARRGEVYVQVFGPGPAPSTEPQRVALAALGAALPQGALCAAGTGAELVCGVLPTARRWRGPGENPEPLPEARFVATLAARALAEQGPDAFTEPPSPLYLRPPDARLPGPRA
ncbi:MAG TPA: tRNA (adenosine(37)-N6)-threonylcarbamoyltransferase complex dimerization subunit type 1 TsaB [Alphaproteobacteria bacterium]|nr:tRNA (adenosine(37)-N6)-threonylcarbamoyltransferase complex dimerization subunit type 1 TsaB [Alphaproteobacteria bacterium]